MQAVRTLLDEHDPREFGSGGKPQLDHVVAPIPAEAEKTLDNASAAAFTSRDDATRMQRPAGFARGDVKNFDGPLDDCAGRDVEYEAVGEKRGIERREWPVTLGGRAFELRPHKIRPLSNRARHR